MQIKSVLIFANEEKVRQAIKKSLRNIGFNSRFIHIIRSSGDGIRQCESLDSALIFLDWLSGADNILRLFEENRKNYRLYSHPSVLLVKKSSEKLSALAKEYDALQISTYEEMNAVDTWIKNILLKIRHPSELREQLSKVEKLREEGQWDASAVICQKFLYLNPQDENWCYHVALNHYKKDRIDEAFEVLSQLLDKPDARIFGLKSDILLGHGKAIEACRYLIASLKLSPYNINRLLKLGNLLINVGRWEEACKAFDRILSFAHKSREGRLGKGAALALTGDLDGAKNLLDNAANTKEVGAVFNSAAIIATRFGKFALASNLYSSASEKLEAYPLIRSRVVFNLGLLAVKSKRPEKATNFFKRAYTLDRNLIEARDNFHFSSTWPKSPSDGVVQNLPVSEEVSVGVLSRMRGANWMDFSEFKFED